MATPAAKWCAELLAVQASASNKPCHAHWRSIIPNANRPLNGGTEKTLRMTGYDLDVPNFVSQWGQVCALAQLCHWRALSARACSYPLPWQDWWIWQNHAQYRKEPGFFVDLASNDAMWASNTYFLEQCLGWRGLCIEPNPVHHERIRAERKCTLVPNCVSDAAKTIEMILPDGFHGGAARVVKEQRDLAVGWGKKPVQMECRTLRSILHEHKVKHIDFMSLDIEGHEPEAMSTLKLGHGGEHGVTIDVVSAETNSSAAYWRAGDYRHFSPEGMEQVFLRPGYRMPIEEEGKPILWPAAVPTCSAGGRRRLAELVENTTLHPKHSMA